MPIRLLLLGLGLVFLSAMSIGAQEDPDDEESPRKPGLIATYQTADGKSSCQRIDETIAFNWQDAPPDPRLAAGRFSATWQGRLWTQAAGTYRLHAFVQGKIKLQLDGKDVLWADNVELGWVSSGPLEFTFDFRALEVQFWQTADKARLALFWSGPGFTLEPIPDRFLFHDREKTISTDFARGRQLAAALRCEACHTGATQQPSMPAPVLDKLSGHIDPAWLASWLSASPPKGDGPLVRRMPHFGLSKSDAADIAAWLVRLPAEKPPAPPEPKKPEPKPTAKSKEKKSPPSAGQGEKLFLTLGCLACHQHGELGESGLFGGGDLTSIAAKRPPEYFARWLADPASLNADHRMPVFELSADERTSLALWLAGQGKAAESAARGDIASGEKLITRLHCAACHKLPQGSPPAKLAQSLTSTSNWSRSCAGSSDPAKSRPGYGLAAADQAAIKTYYASQPAAPMPAANQAAGRDLLVELNCLACHLREGIDRKTAALPARLQDKLAGVVALHDDLGKQVPAMTPPALNSVGDKLTDSALAAAIRREGPPHRTYLQVRMPRFRLSDEQLATLTAYFISTDRIPRGAGVPPAAIATTGPTPAPQLAAAGPRLVTTDGFGCTSCHQVGSVLPDKAPLNARGPTLSLIEKRIRREWFDRWCANPARIVPRMEMPSVQVPVRGVLGDNVRDQLAAVWHTLNTPGFEPPEPNPVRVLRLSGVPERKEAPIVLHDVIKDGDKTYLFPLVIGLPNRHNVLFDLETNRLAAWWLGDTARQRTKGKSWYWEQGGKAIFEPGISDSEISFVLREKEYLPLKQGQFAAILNSYKSPVTIHKIAPDSAGLQVLTRLEFDLPPSEAPNHSNAVRVDQFLAPLPTTDQTQATSGFLRTIYFAPRDRHTDFVPHKEVEIRVRLVGADKAKSATWDGRSRQLQLGGAAGLSISVLHPADIKWNGDGSVSWTPAHNVLRGVGPYAMPPTSILLRYETALPADQYLAEPSARLAVEASQVEIAPGVSGRRLPLPDDIMPTALAWRSDGTLTFTSLKGQVFSAIDYNNDGLEESLQLCVDGLATPYGLLNSSDVVTKTGVVRIRQSNSQQTSIDVIATGWGVTDDYHDWAIGLTSAGAGEYYIGLPCQQDGRSEAAAKYRGQVLKLVPCTAKDAYPRLYDIETFSTGHRFPMGLALNREGALFVTDNQGNYNPFNELNHVRQGAFFGFVNAIDKEKGAKPPPLTPPAIDIPHPWTRSVNGICFLDTPKKRRDETGFDAFGPLEGHLIGCEYDSRQLIRMTLQKVGETYQGAAYPLSIPPRNIEDGLLGPLVCAVSPRGELYVGNIRDSGWGAGNNVGDIVKIKIEPEKLPCGIREVRATSEGFTLDFFRPVDPAKAADSANYSIASYRRESTSAYGGPNLDRRVEKIAQVQVSPDARQVTLKLADLREGFVYEFQLKPLTRGKELFHPAEAHYTLRQVPN